jgi:hypothetical protein
LHEDQNFYWNYGLCKHQDQQWLKICQVDNVNLKLIRHKINTKEYQLIYKKSEVYNSWYITNMAPSYTTQEISQNKTYIWQWVITNAFKFQISDYWDGIQSSNKVCSSLHTLHTLFCWKKEQKKRKEKTWLTTAIYYC